MRSSSRIVLAGLGISSVVTSVLGAVPAAAGAPGPDVAPGEIVVRFERSLPERARERIRADVAARKLERVRGIPGLEVLGTEPGSERAAAEELAAQPGVRYAEPNYLYRLDQSTTPDDTEFAKLWGLHNVGQTGGVPDADIDAPEAWLATQGSPDVLVAVVDTGVDVAHTDLSGNIDPRGWDWIDGDATPQDPNGHGTHVAGTIAARGGNGLGVAGVGWMTRILPLRTFTHEGYATSSNIAAAFVDARLKGAKVVNASFGGSGRSTAIANAISSSPDILFVAAAGNNGTNNDSQPLYPCNEPAANVVCVAATTHTDALAYFSNHGATSVDLGAPGTSIRSTAPGSAYATMSGTSMAAPHVTGVAGLVLASDPGASVAEVKEALLSGSDPRSTLSGKTVSGGRLNAVGSLAAIGAEIPPAPPVASIAPASAVQRDTQFAVRWQQEGIERYDVRYRSATVTDGFGDQLVWFEETPEIGATFPGEPSTTYCFSARSADDPEAAWGEQRCTAVPMNDRSLVRRGRWSLRSTEGAYMGTESVSRRRRAALTSDVRAKRISLVATTCPACGSVKVVWNGSVIRRLSLRSSELKRRKVISVASWGSARRGTVKVVVTSRKKPVRVEGLAVSSA